MFSEDITSDKIILALAILYAGSFLVQMFYYWRIFGRLAFYKIKPPENLYKPVSVIICAKNEYSNLKINLPLILEQDYPDFEVVVVNDCSDDETSFLLKSFSEKYPRLNVVNILRNVNFFTGKKFALALGIKSAKYDLVLLTDADCAPKSGRWIAGMANNFKAGTEIILGYSGFEEKKGLVNKLIRYDTIMTAIQYLSWAEAGKTYMGVGRNLAYNRNLFFNTKGFSSHYHIPSGDDDLFINQVATKKNTAIEISADAQTISPAKSTYREWVIQKKRHLSTGVYYKFFHKFMLGMFPFCNFIFYTTFAALIIIFGNKCYLHNIIFISSLLLIKTASQMIILKKSMNKLGERNLLVISPLFEIMLVLLNPLIAFSNTVQKERKWK